MQKKVKFGIQNNSADEWLDLRGGRDGSIYLYVAYPDDFIPTVRLPLSDPVEEWQASIGQGGSPEGKTVTVTPTSQSVTPDRVDEEVSSQLGLGENWSAWAIPANPNGLVTELYDNSLTFPTWATEYWLEPGEYYRGEGNGIGAWVFYIPLQDAIKYLPDEKTADASLLSNEHMDQYYRVVGVGVRDRNGRTVGFAPTPPESSFSLATDF